MKQCFAEAKEQVQQLNDMDRGMIRIGYVNGWNIGTYMQPVLREMRLEYPGIRISLEAYTLQELSARFQMGQMDLIITLQDRTAKMYDAESMLIDTAQEMFFFPILYFGQERKTGNQRNFVRKRFRSGR